MPSDPRDRFRVKVAAFLGAIGTANLFFSIFSGASAANAGKTMNNIHWLLAGWGNVAIFVTSVAILAYGPLSRRLGKHPDPIKLPEKQKGHESLRKPATDEPPAPPVAVGSALPINSPREVAIAIESAPPFQQAAMRKHFEGVSVNWLCSFFSAEMSADGTVRVCVYDVNDKYPLVGVHFNLAQASCPGIGLLARNTNVLVTGVIESLEHGVQLKNAAMRF